MSAFECNITPTRFRVEKKRNEDREPTYVDLRPFSGKAIVTFENVPVTKTARRLIIVSNPLDEVLKVKLTKEPKPELNVTLEWTCIDIAPQSQKNLEISWNPKKVVACREVIQLTDENGNKKEVAVILKSCELKKSKGEFPKRLKLKTPPRKKFARSASTGTTPPSNSKLKSPAIASKKMSVTQTVSPLRNSSNLRAQSDFYDRSNVLLHKILPVDKENNALLTPRNASAIFSSIRFTPLTETKPKNESRLEYLSSLPTPVGAKRDDIVVRDQTSRRNIIEDDSALMLRMNLIPTVEYQLVNDTVQSSTFEKIEECNEINEIDTVLDEHSMLGSTRVVSKAALCVISEEDPQLVTQTEFYKTFEVNKSLSYERIFEESMREIYPNHEDVQKLRANNRSMPNLNEIDISVGLIDHNRYFCKQQQTKKQDISLDSVVSNTDFRETEICAQSSCYNLNELVSPVSNHIQLVTDDSTCQFHRATAHFSPSFRRVQNDLESNSPPQKKMQKMVFSPPVRNNLRTEIGMMQSRDASVNSHGRQIRATTWKQQQSQQVFAVPKAPRDLKLQKRPNLVTQSLTSLSSSSIASAGSTCSTPVKKGKLYNENYIDAYNQQDPFSASTTVDPFLSSTMYLDEKTLDNIEKTYMKWLNALVTLPVDLESYKNERIDVGKLFNDVQSKELTLAPTKETVCSRYYTARLDSLRSSAVQFFHSETIATPLRKITVVINEKNHLEVKAERSIHLDLVLQRNLLELLLCYNPLWLRIGLEIVFNVQLNLQSNQDIFGMIHFIISNMFKSQYLAEKYSKFSQQKEYLEKLRKFTIKNFLFIFFFLDRAKECRLIKQNPCLFVRQAPYKESNEILKKFASLVLANYGDIMKTLRRFDYTLTHKQTVIDEYDFAFKNLAIDLRDGVRLTKVMEVVLLRDDLVQKVRVPAISRLQKVYNVDLALKALETADYKILGNISSKDIADGHREKTLSLLWQIIYKFRAPRFNAAAMTLQKFWRSKYLMVVINKRIKSKQEQKRNQAATVIQKYYRGWKSRQETTAFLKSKIESCITIQKFVRGFIVRRRYQVLIKSVVCIQRWYRQTLVVKDVREQFQLRRKSATIIQKWWRWQLLARKLIASSVIIGTIQDEAVVRHKSAIIIQDFFKSLTIYSKFHKIVDGIVCRNRAVHKANQAAINIQSFVRMRKEQKQFKELKETTIIVQHWWRHVNEGKKQRKGFLSMKQSTIKIQQWFRGVMVMKSQRIEFLRYRECVVTVQTRFRANLLMRRQRDDYQILRTATVNVQKRFRAAQLMRKQRKQYQNLRRATSIIQKRFRARLEMKIQRQEYHKVIKSVTFIQQKFLATLLMKKQRQEFLKLKSAALMIQHFLKSVIIRKKLQEVVHEIVCRNRAVHKANQAAIKIQLFVRMRKEQKQFKELKETTIIVQHWWRHVNEGKKQRKGFLSMKQSTIKIQQWFRGVMVMKSQRIEFLRYRECVVTVQTRFRANLLMRRQRDDYQILRTATVNVQKRFIAAQLMRKQRKQYQNLRRATSIIQRRFRARLEMKIQRQEYHKVIKSVTFIQQKFLATLLMKKQRQEFLKLKSAALMIQHFLKSVIIRKKLHEVVHEIVCRNRAVHKANQAAINIQSFVRMRKEQKQFKELKKSSIIVQHWWRHVNEGKKQRKGFLSMKQSTIKIQQWFRGVMLMKSQRIEYLRYRECVVTVQTRFRANLLMRRQRDDYQILRTATVNVQKQFIAVQLMRKQRKEYQNLRRATSIFQKRFRAKLQLRTQNNTAIKIQQWFRSCKLTEMERSRFLLLKKTVQFVENRIQANRTMFMYRKKFQELRSVAIFIQRRFRSKLKARKLQQWFKNVRSMTINLQSSIRGFQARQRFLEMKTPEQLELRDKHKAARTIQAFWRGYRERSRNSNRCLKGIAKRLIKSTRHVDPAQTLAAKLKTSLSFLKQNYDSNVAISFLAKLEYMARTVPWILINDAEFVSTFCYGLMAQAIRSEVDKQIIELCSCIILNLSRYKDTKENAFQEHGLLTIAQMLLRWCDKDCGIFNTLCTLVWVFAHCEKKQKIIRDFMIKDGDFIVGQIKQNVSRKENMRKNSRRPIGFQSISLTKYKKDYQMQLRYTQPQASSTTTYSSGFITPEMLQQCHELPSFLPDYGVVKTTPYIFYSSVFAYDNVLKVLEIRHS